MELSELPLHSSERAEATRRAAHRGAPPPSATLPIVALGVACIYLAWAFHAALSVL